MGMQLSIDSTAPLLHQSSSACRAHPSTHGLSAKTTPQPSLGLLHSMREPTAGFVASENSFHPRSAGLALRVTPGQCFSQLGFQVAHYAKLRVIPGEATCKLSCAQHGWVEVQPSLCKAPMPGIAPAPVPAGTIAKEGQLGSKSEP